MNNFDIIKDNVRQKRTEIRNARIKSKSVLSELAYEMFKTADAENVMSLLADARDRVTEYINIRDSAETEDFTDRVLFRLEEKMGRKILLSDFYPEKTGAEKTVYVKSRYTDMAYDVFSSEFVYPTVLYADDTVSVFELLDKKKADYAIVQTADFIHGEIPGMHGLLDEYGVRICAKTSFLQSDGNTLELSLISSGYSEFIGHSDSLYMSFGFYQSGGNSMLKNAISAIEYFGAEVCSIKSKNDGHTLFDGRYDVRVFGTKESIIKVLTYLNIFCNGFTFFGIWKPKTEVIK